MVSSMSSMWVVWPNGSLLVIMEFGHLIKRLGFFECSFEFKHLDMDHLKTTETS